VDRLTWIFVASVLSAPTLALAQKEPIALCGALIYTVDGDPIESGALVVRAGRIEAVGPMADVEIPAGARVIDSSGKIIVPGLICTHSHVGGIGGADSSAPIQPDVRIYDSIDVRDPGFRRAVAGGLTCLNIMPGSGHLMSGQTVYLKLRRADTIEELFIRTDDGRIAGGMKMANGTNSMRAAPFPGTRGKSAALVRQKFLQAVEYRDAIVRAAGDASKRPPRDLGLEAMVEVLEGKRIVHHHTHRHDDILTVLRLAKEFGFRVVLHHVSEGWKVAEEIAAANVPCSVILLDSPGGKLEAIDLARDTGAILERAGIDVAFHTDDWITDSRLFLRMPAFGVRAGMSREAALRAVTIAGARMLDLAERTGSLRAGKDADFVVLDGDPFSVYTKVLETWVEGERVFDRTDAKDRLYAVGGYGAGSATKPYLCCQDHDDAEGAHGR
jgi:imidazolonepropionase-like amidohydrolase